MEPHVERMLQEAKELKAKIDKLVDFLPTDKFKSLSQAEQDLLGIQLNAMTAYFGALCVRLRMTGVEP